MTATSAKAVAARQGDPLVAVLPPQPSTRWTPVPLSVPERHDLVDVWATMFADVYVHYEQKRSLYGHDPIRALAALRRQIPYLIRPGSSASSHC